MPLTLYLHQIGNTKCIHQQKKKTKNKKKGNIKCNFSPIYLG